MLQTVSSSIVNAVGFGAWRTSKNDVKVEDVFAPTQSYMFHCLPILPTHILNLVTCRNTKDSQLKVHEFNTALPCCTFHIYCPSAKYCHK